MYFDGNSNNKNNLAPVVSADIAWITAFVIFCAYLFGYEALFRPLENGPATNILTLVLIVFAASVSLGFSRASQTPPVFVTVMYLGLLISLERLVEASLGPNYLQGWINSVVLSGFPINQELPNITSWNTALFFSCYFVALWGFMKRRSNVMLASTGVAALNLVIALIGYGLAIPALYGNMSLTTLALCGVLLFGVVNLFLMLKRSCSSSNY